MKDAKYLMAFSVPLSVFISIYFRGIFSYTSTLYVFLFIPIVELFLPTHLSAFSEQQSTTRLKDKFFDWLLYFNVPIVYLILIYGLYSFASSNIQAYEYFGFTLSLGILLATNAVNVAHELGHRNNKFDIFENKNDYVIYKIKKMEERVPDLSDSQTKNEIIQLISQKNKFDYNNELLEKINKNIFDQNQFLKMGQNIVQSITLNSIKDNNRFDINAVELLFSLPTNSFTLINDEKNKIYLAKIIRFKDKEIDTSNENYTQYINKHNTYNKTNILQSYDVFLNDKYKVVLNHQTIKRVKNFFQ